MMNDKPTYALSVKPPWGWLMCKNLKDGENRGWSLPSHIFNKRVYIHSSRSHSDMTREVYDWILERLKESDKYEFQKAFNRMTFGAIIGEVTFTCNQRDSKSVWYVGDNFFVCTNGMLYEQPIWCRGQLGFFKPDIPVTMF